MAASLPILFLLTHLAFLALASTCYFPNGLVSPSDTPCNPSSPESFCCYGLQICTNNKFCIDPVSSTIWNRGSCTDKNWGPACQQFCQNVSISTGSALTPCTNDGEWVCGTDKEDCGDSAKILTLGVPIPTAMASGKVLSASGAAATSGACATGASGSDNGPVTTMIDASGLTSGQKIGLGIGIPLAVLLLVSSGSVAYLVRKRARQVPVNTGQGIPTAWVKRESSSMSEWQTRSSASSTPWKKTTSIIVEAPDAFAGSVELPATEIKAKAAEASPIIGGRGSILGSWFKD